MEASEIERLKRFTHGLHGALLVCLIALRPLVWDGDAASPSNLVYLALILIALLVTAVEVACGGRKVLRWSWLGVTVALFVTALLPAALHAPVPPDGATFWWQLVLHLGLGAYLLQVVPGRERLAWAALATGLVAEVAISWIQGLWVLPRMAEATRTNDAAIAMEGVSNSDLAERIARGGWFGTFTLSNTLAAWLLLVAVPVAGAVWRQGIRLLPLLITVAAAGLLICTRSKGALVALAIAGGLWWMVYRRGWSRWLPLPLGMLALTAALSLPTVHDGLAASARVRLGYWSGAVELVRSAPLTGLGVGAFAERASGVMPLWAEPSKMVHNEPLELAVVAGIPLALVLMALLIWCAWPRALDRQPMGGDAPRPPVTAAAVALAVLIGYLGLLGLLDGNVGWWPGGGTLAGQAQWTLLIGLVMAALLWLLRDLPLPAVLWLRLGLAATAVHCLVDFDLHSFAVIGTLFTVAVLAASTHRELPVRRWVGGTLLVAVLLLIVGGMGWARSALSLRAADDMVRSLRLASDPPHADDGFHDLAMMLDAEEPAAGDRNGRVALAQLAIMRAQQLAAADPTRQVQILSVLPPSAARLARLDELYGRLPFYALVANLRAQDLSQLQRWDEAVAEQRRGVALAPAYLPAQQQLIRLLSSAADQDLPRAVFWRAERAAAEQHMRELEPVVDYRNRLK